MLRVSLGRDDEADDDGAEMMKQMMKLRPRETVQAGRASVPGSWIRG